jgi:hypothetical protein
MFSPAASLLPPLLPLFHYAAIIFIISLIFSFHAVISLTFSPLDYFHILPLLR